MVGLTAAKAMALALNVPLIGFNHLQAHVFACRIAAGHDVFPCIGLVASGGHSSLYRCQSSTDFCLLGGTIDDAAGEAFDKVASMLGLPYPGGPAVSKTAEEGDAAAYRFPRPLLGDSKRLEFSFSGLKTAVRYQLAPPGEPLPEQLEEQDVCDMAASFQEAVVDCLVAKSTLALQQTGMKRLCVGGGVAANKRLRERLAEQSVSHGFELLIAPLKLCTDNAVMGAIAVEYLKAGATAGLALDIQPGLQR